MRSGWRVESAGRCGLVYVDGEDGACLEWSEVSGRERDGDRGSVDGVCLALE